jgi:hypothetical protein
MWGKRKAETARRFLAALCTGDSAAFEAMIARDAVYIDGRGVRLEGFDACSAGAQAFHELEPDYRVNITETITRGNKVLIRGVAEARNPQLSGELLIQFSFRGDLICEWQVHRHRASSLVRMLGRGSPDPDPSGNLS